MSASGDDNRAIEEAVILCNDEIEIGFMNIVLNKMWKIFNLRNKYNHLQRKWIKLVA